VTRLSSGDAFTIALGVKDLNVATGDLVTIQASPSSALTLPQAMTKDNVAIHSWGTIKTYAT
jgi:hypothetical protein